MGVDVSIVRYPILGSSQPEGLSFIACPDRSGSMSSLTGTIEWNLGPSFMTGLAWPSCDIPLLLYLQPDRFLGHSGDRPGWPIGLPSMEILWAW